MKNIHILYNVNHVGSIEYYLINFQHYIFSIYSIVLK